MNDVGKVPGLSQTYQTPFVDDELWDKWWVIVLITAILAAEWILRKVVRLV